MAWSFDRVVDRTQWTTGMWYVRLAFVNDDGREEVLSFKFAHDPSGAEITAAVLRFLASKNDAAKWSVRVVLTNARGDTRTILMPLASGITALRLRNLMNNVADVLATEALSDG